MASEILRLTAQIVMSHASMTELTPKELVAEIKQLYHVLASLEDEVEATGNHGEGPRAAKTRPAKMVESPEAKAIQDEEGLEFTARSEDQLEFMASREG